MLLVGQSIWSMWRTDSAIRAVGSLEEAEQFIGENSHLPEIPSETDVMQNGVNLDEMDGLLLKKIEELTLYVIQQQKEIEKLKHKLNNSGL